jgi:methylated-DNA-protein-cysteine methyltransferase-like protein
MGQKSLFERIKKRVKKIPAGKVATYGQIASSLGLKDARIVGWALHSNKDPKTPCHRVVNRKGRLAPGFSFGGSEEQKYRLSLEGISFLNEDHVNLKKHQI